MSDRVKQGLHILMADDSEEDVFFANRALKQSGVPYSLRHVMGGAEAISYLKGEGEFSDRAQFPFPNVLLCDLKMPGVDGYGVLRWLQAHPHCKVIPTIMFSSSALETDVHQSYVLGANAYLTKPHSLDEFADTLVSLYQFWSRCQVPLPPHGEKCHEQPN